MAGVFAHHGFPEGLSHSGVGEPESFAEGDFVRGFIIFAFRFIRWRAHQEGARFDPAEILPHALVGEAHEDAVVVFAPVGRPGFGEFVRKNGVNAHKWQIETGPSQPIYFSR